jgi:hypothetical protein
MLHFFSYFDIFVCHAKNKKVEAKSETMDKKCEIKRLDRLPSSRRLFVCGCLFVCQGRLDGPI